MGYEEYKQRKVNSWIARNIFNCREEVCGTDTWKKLKQGDKFSVKEMYKELRLQRDQVEWRKLFFNNDARPRACFITWMICWRRVYTKDRLSRFGMVNDEKCYLCDGKETVNHLFFECNVAKEIWSRVLSWLGEDRQVKEWDEELKWVLRRRHTKGRVLRRALTEAAFFVWQERNAVRHGECLRRDGWKEVCNVVAARSERSKVAWKVVLAADGRK